MALLGGLLAIFGALLIGLIVTGAEHWERSAVLWCSARCLASNARPSAQRAPDGLGLVILAITRPFEGMVLSLPVAILLAWIAGAKASVAHRFAFRRPATLLGRRCAGADQLLLLAGNRKSFELP